MNIGNMDVAYDNFNDWMAISIYMTKQKLNSNHKQSKCDPK